jgi:hypothetical protein
MTFVVERWLREQRRYFDDRSKKSHQQSESMERWVSTSLSLAIGFAIAAFLGVVYAQYLEADWLICPDCEWLDWPIIAIDSFLAAGALLHHANYRRAHAEHRKQYTRMANIFENARRAVERAPDLVHARPCLAALGREALAEHGDWVLLHRERPLELPHP